MTGDHGQPLGQTLRCAAIWLDAIAGLACGQQDKQDEKPSYSNLPRHGVTLPIEASNFVACRPSGPAT